MTHTIDQLIVFAITLTIIVSCGESRELERLLFDTDPEKYGYIITFPNGGDVLDTHSEYLLSWEFGSKTSDRVDIYYSIDSGDSWSFLAKNELNDGAFTWTTPYLFQSAQYCLIKIEDAGDILEYDISDEFFTIIPDPESLICGDEMSSTGSGVVTSPAGGIAINLGTTTIVNWTFSGPGQVNILLYSENIYIATLQGWAINDGEYNFSASSSLSPGACYQIVIMNPYDSSDYIVGPYFTIQ